MSWKSITCHVTTISEAVFAMTNTENYASYEDMYNKILHMESSYPPRVSKTATAKLQPSEHTKGSMEMLGLY